MAQAPETVRTAPETPQLTSGQRKLALFVCIAAAFLTLLDVSIVTVALPTMERSLKMSSADISWTVAGYTLGFGLLLIPGGRLGDEFGRKKLFILGLALFTVTGVLCAIAPDAVFLDASRLARGVAAGLVAPQVFGLIHQMYSPRERGRAFGYYGAAVGLSNAIGPILGGAVIQVAGQSDGWRYIFWLMVPLSVAALIMALRVLPPDQRAVSRRTLDTVGAGLLALAVVAVMLPLVQSAGGSIPRPWLIAVGAVLLAVFVVWEFALRRRGRQPLVDISLFRVRGYWVGTLVAAAFYGGFTGVFLVLTEYLQEGLRYSALHASLIGAVFTAGSAICAIICSRLIHRVGRSLVIGGAGVTALGLGGAALLIRFHTGTGIPPLLPVLLLVAGCGAGCVIAANQTLALHYIPRREGSSAGGVYQTGMKIGTSLGVTVASALFFVSLTSGHSASAAGAASAGHYSASSASGHNVGGASTGTGAGTGTGASAGAQGSHPDTGSGLVRSASSYAKAASIGVGASAGLVMVAFVIAAAGFGTEPRRRFGTVADQGPASGHAYFDS
jgi:EmrB/QacA subfamily drug resistance transporter